MIDKMQNGEIGFCDVDSSVSWGAFLNLNLMVDSRTFGKPQNYHTIYLDINGKREGLNF